MAFARRRRGWLAAWLQDRRRGRLGLHNVFANEDGATVFVNEDASVFGNES